MLSVDSEAGVQREAILSTFWLMKGGTIRDIKLRLVSRVFRKSRKRSEEAGLDVVVA